MGQPKQPSFTVFRRLLNTFSTPKEAGRKMASNSSSDNWEMEKKKLANLPLAERRKNYFCRDKYVPVSQVPTWRDYFNEQQKSLTEKVSEKDINAFSVDESDLATGPIPDWLPDKVSIFRGDITKLEIDAIANAAKETLLGGGGVDGAIHRGAGGLLLQECRTLNGCETGQAKITCGYTLPAKYIVHTVGPVGEKPELLKSCYETSLKLMVDNNLRTIAFPCISTGIYGYPPQNAARVALKAVRQFLAKHHNEVDQVIFCLFHDNDVDIYEKLLQMYFPVSKTSNKS